MICPNCNSYVSPEWEFCRSCGKPLDVHKKDKVCSKCGTMNFSFAVKCEKCGEPFEKVLTKTKKHSIWDSWVGITVATAFILILLLVLYLWMLYR